jgi:tetratricopeptide (TPR) repeat protein
MVTMDRGTFDHVKMQDFIRAAAIVALLSATATVRADVTKAKQLYSEGRTQYNLADYAKALDLFKRAYQEQPDPAFLFNIAQCERSLGRYDDAEKSYRAYLRESPDLPQQRVAEIKVLIGAMQAAAQQQRANLPPPGTEPPRTVSPPPQPTTAPQPPPITYVDTGKTLRIAGAATVGAGVVLLALGGVFAGLSYKAGQDAYHPSSDVYDPSADSRQTNFRNADIACFVVGGAAAVVGTVVWVMGRNRRETPTTRTAVAHFIGGAVAF